MKPPICEVCNLDFRNKLDDEAGDLVKFYDFEGLPNGMAGQPNGLGWFCIKHINSAKKLSHLTKQEAIRQIIEK